MSEQEKVVIPNLKTLRKSLSDMTDEELDKAIGNVRADRRKLVSDQGKIKRKGAKVKKTKKADALSLMSEDDKAELKKFLEGRNS